MKFQQTCVWELKGIHGLCRSYVCPHLLWCLDFSFQTWCYSDFKTLQRRQPPSEESGEKAAGLLVGLGALLRGEACASLLWLRLAASTATRAPHLTFTTCERHWGTAASFSPADGASLGSFHLSILHAEQSPRAYWTLGIFKVFLKLFWKYFKDVLNIFKFRYRKRMRVKGLAQSSSCPFNGLRFFSV